MSDTSETLARKIAEAGWPLWPNDATGQFITRILPLIREHDREREQEIARLKEQIAELSFRSVCTYCGHMEEAEDAEVRFERMAAHIVTCEKHPLHYIPALVEERDAARRKLDEAEGLLKKARYWCREDKKFAQDRKNAHTATVLECIGFAAESREEVIDAFLAPDLAPVAETEDHDALSCPPHCKLETHPSAAPVRPAETPETADHECDEVCEATGMGGYLLGERPMPRGVAVHILNCAQHHRCIVIEESGTHYTAYNVDPPAPTEGAPASEEDIAAAVRRLCKGPNCITHRPPAPSPVEAPRGEAWLVWSNEHGLWWGPYRCGYTADRSRAGRYTAEEAEAICKLRSKGDGHPIPEVMVMDCPPAPLPESAPDKCEWCLAGWPRWQQIVAGRLALWHVKEGAPMMYRLCLQQVSGTLAEPVAAPAKEEDE